ncbi:NTP transferase domain-containing protein [Novosphingobium sp.]|uniref:phosphocholine cytidylyltransferase family protein n=1 Tax=Novosphingobium sp. TaxID=1874826 RepID=UPI0025D637FD|nr:NTP transferase domain-containing protein [Novosphingobium sp.]
MDALIIAAGFGSRLRDISDSKPMTPIAGIPLLELGVRQARAAGAGRVVVVTGHEADRLEAALPALADRAGIPVVAQRVEDWSKPNGWSVMAGASVIAGDYLLMMSDHIFSDTILTRLARQGGADRGVTLAIDRRVDSPLVDPDDATWVKLDDRGFISAIGKTIPDYDAVDCGAFLATPGTDPGDCRRDCRRQGGQPFGRDAAPRRCGARRDHGDRGGLVARRRRSPDARAGGGRGPRAACRHLRSEVSPYGYFIVTRVVSPDLGTARRTDLKVGRPARVAGLFENP